MTNKDTNTASKRQAITPLKGGHYNWIGQPERLVYMGTTRYPGDRRTWHRFAKVTAPNVCYSEVLTSELVMLEETKGSQMTTTPTIGAADLLNLIEAYAEARHLQGHSSYNAQTATARRAVKEALAQRFDAADMATAAAQGFRDGVASLTAQAVVQDDLITIRKPTTSAEMLWLLKLARLVISDVNKTLEETFAPAQPAAEPSRFGSPELQAMIIARCAEKDQADSVQEDAARYRWLREGNDAKHGAAWHVAVNLYGCEWDAAIDAARKQGATQ